MGGIDEPDLGQRDIAFMGALAPQYDDLVTKDFSIYHSYHLEPYLRRLAKRLPAAKLLDLGCGTAVVGLAAATSGFVVTGFDHSSAMLEVAERKARALGLDQKITFVLGEVDSLPFPDDSFDAVACQRMLHHLPSMKPALSELRRVLRPGGSFYISDYCRDQTPLKTMLVQVKRKLVGSRGNISRLTGERSPSCCLPDSLSSEDETPISGTEFLDLLSELGLACETILFLTHLGYRRYVSDRVRMALVRCLSVPWQRTKGNMVFATGYNPAAAGHDAVSLTQATRFATAA